MAKTTKSGVEKVEIACHKNWMARQIWTNFGETNPELVEIYSPYFSSTSFASYLSLYRKDGARISRLEAKRLVRLAAEQYPGQVDF